MSNRIYFHGLNELRAIAALFVLCHHIEEYKHKLKFQSLFDSKVFSNIIRYIGQNGVDLFFVLSGFLITYLLLAEIENKGKISIKQFYIRRILRIWPLYFIVIAISFIVLPFLYYNYQGLFEGQDYFNQLIEWTDYKRNLLLFIFFLSNIALWINGPVVGASQSWSVSVEEQFYLLWPWVVKTFHKVLIPFLIALIILKTKLDAMIDGNQIEINKWLWAFMFTFKVEYLAMGALFAKLYKYKNSTFEKVLKNKPFFLLVLLISLFQLYIKFSNIATAFSFAILILCFIERKIKIKPLEYLGSISYGIYMYHPIIIYLGFSLAFKLGVFDTTLLNLFVYPIILLSTITISNLSYKYVEIIFLKIKDKFAPIKSGVS
jgi:peptidoglycan/LPS O-acetylase OafA/YrhL